MSDQEFTIVDPVVPAAAPPSRPAVASPQSTPVRPKRKARALSVGDDDEEEEDEGPTATTSKKAAAKRPAAKKRTAAPPKERRSTIFLEDPPSAAGRAGATLRPVSDPSPTPVSTPVSVEPAPVASQPAAPAAASSQPGVVAPTPMAVPSSASATESSELLKLRSELEELRATVAMLRPREAEAVLPQLPSLSTDPFQLAMIRTAPNTKGEMPPAQVCHLAAAMFAMESKKVKGQFNPPQVHSLAAHRLWKDLGYPPFEGKYSSPTAFLLALRELDCVKFPVTAALLMAMYSGRCGNHGATIMMFKECDFVEALERGASNANFVLDFSANAAVDPSPPCVSYENLLDAIHGLSAVANEAWYEHGRKLIYRLRVFVSKNRSADPAGSPARIHMTRLFVDRFLGRALAALQVEGDHWWQLYCDQLWAIDYNNAEWTMALVNALHSAQAPAPALAPGAASGARPSREAAGLKRPSHMPADVKALVPRNRNGEEPCLRHFSGAGCPGGRDRCTNKKLLHRWPSQLPSLVLDWARANMRPARTPESHGDHGTHA